MLEVELKFPVTQPEPVEQKLLALGARRVVTENEEDHYFNAPDRDFAQTDEALRLRMRQRLGHEDVFITYKGPKLDLETKTRREIELLLGTGTETVKQWSSLLRELGFRFVARLAKQRTTYELARDGLAVHVLFDQVADVGDFVEIEALVPEEGRQAAQAALLALAKELGLEGSVRRSYLELWLERHVLPKQAMHVVKSVAELRQAVADARQRRLTIGLVPTMGALHAGHGSLLAAAKKECGFVVATIFVNPTQFGPTEDFHRYPRPLEDDLKLCFERGVDLVFTPEVSEMYPSGDQTIVEVTELQRLWEGAVRRGHFRGVATVVTKLFNQVQPDVAYFGQKDGQQARIIQQMVRDLHFPITIRICPTLREADGLALSSRNSYLSQIQRGRATVLSKAMAVAQSAINDGEWRGARLQELMREAVAAVPETQLDYAAIVDPLTLQPLDTVAGQALALLAVRLGGTRLIDNQLLVVPGTDSTSP